MGEGCGGALEADALNENEMAEALFDPTNLVAVLEDLANDVREGYRDTLERNKHVASGNLIGNLSTEITVDGTVYTVWLNLEDYWKFVEYDTKPHWAPIRPLIEWARDKIRIGLALPRPDGKIPTPEQLAHAAQWKIHAEGTTGTHDLRKTEDAVLSMYEERLLEALERDALNYIEKVMP